ncbi:PepSY domain-containing protein [Legionella sp.]|uniref:PepSY domain-containing protein n=1 Tax=Legionella sp. TaxID=459 RepID=UPI000CC8E5F9|nr:PepSY domain-containing protein [Legionella sp.]PJE18219.1 MAG: peptidase [Legionella sp.]
MKMKTIVLSSLVLVCSAAFADSAQPKVSIQQALSAAEKAGYTNIQKIEFEHGQWEVEGRDAQGKKFEVKIDASTGTLSKDND